MSLHIGSLLHQPSAETLPDDLFAAGPARRSLVEHEKSGMIEAEQGRGDLSSLGRTQITATGVDPASSHTRQIPVYWWNLGKSRPMSFHDASQWCARPGHAKGRSPVKSYSYRERDYAFGQLILTLRTRIGLTQEDRKSTRLNSSHSQISYAVFCLKKKNSYDIQIPPTHFCTSSLQGAYPAHRSSSRLI